MLSQKCCGRLSSRLSLFSLHFVDFLCLNHPKNLPKVQRSDSVHNLRSGSIFVSLLKLHSGGQGETKRDFSGSR